MTEHTGTPVADGSSAPPTLRFGTGIGPRQEGFLDRLDDWTRLAEQTGVELIATGEAPHLFGDPYILMSLVAERSTHALVGPIVTTPHFRHPAVLASTVATVQEVSHGRAFLGIGTGTPGFLEGIGQKPTPVDAFVEYAMAVKKLAAGESVIWDGAQIRLNWASEAVPVLFAAEGRRALRAAGQYADGAIVGNGATPEKVRFSLAEIAAGAAQAGRSIDELDIWFMVRMHVAESEAQGADDLGFYAARWVPHALGSKAAMEARGVELPPDIAERVARYLAEYSLEHAHSGSRYNTDLLEKHGLKEWVTRQFLLTGSVDHIARQAQPLIDAGARNMIVVQTLPDYMRNTEDAGEIFKAIRQRQATTLART